jgi:hypothetical protein
MKSQRYKRLASVFVFSLALATTGSARAQWEIPVYSGYPAVNQFGIGYGGAQGFSALNYGHFDPVGFGYGPSNFIGFPAPCYLASIGQRPLTTNSYQSLGYTVSLVPSWNGSAHRVHRRSHSQSTMPRPVLRYFYFTARGGDVSSEVDRNGDAGPHHRRS